MDIRGARVLVTGGAGFVGSHLSERLVSAGAQVRVLDNFSTGDRRNLETIIGEIELVEGDIRDKVTVSRVMEGIDIVFHQAAQINPARAVEDPMFDFEVNVRGTLNLLFEALRRKVKKFIMASTNVYGNANVPTMKESYSTLFEANSLLSPYAAAKVSAEAYLKVANDELGLPTIRLRYTNVYGPRQLSKSESGVIAIFVKAALRGDSIRIFGDGTHSRDFVFISDVVEANMLAARNDDANGGVFNIGTGVETSVNELAELVNEMTGANVPIVHVEDRAADFKRIKADLTNAREALGYTPRVRLKDGLRSYIDWCKENIERL
jgi:UDP-glucose 4-epimerase